MVLLNKKQIETLCLLCDGAISITTAVNTLSEGGITIELITCAEDLALIVNIEQYGDGAIFKENDQAYRGYEIVHLKQPFMKKPRPFLRLV